MRRTGRGLITRFREERGISAVVVTVCLIAIFGAAMLSVDAGQLWTARRNAVTATDAAALAQARSYALNHPAAGTTTCQSGVWDTILNANVSDLIDSSCSVVTTNGQSGYVVVTARKRSRARFSGVVGVGDTAAYSLSAAEWGFVNLPIALRPITLCKDDPSVTDALNVGNENPPTWPIGTDWAAPDGSTDYAGRTPGVVHHIAFNPAVCQALGGNFGWLNLANYWPGGQNLNSGNNTPDPSCANPPPPGQNYNNSCGLSDWLQYGWNDPVRLSPLPTLCDTMNYPTQPQAQYCNGTTGAKSGNGMSNALNYLMNPSNPVSNGNACGPPTSLPVCDPMPVPIILYSSTAGQGGVGTFAVDSIAMVRIWGYKLPSNDRYLDLEFMNWIVSGSCCAANPSGPHAPPGTKLCDVDHDSRDLTTLCTPT